MSDVTTKAAEVQANLDAANSALDTLTTGIAALDQMIIDFQNSPGPLTPEDEAALDAIVTNSAALSAKAAAISTAPPAKP